MSEDNGHNFNNYLKKTIERYEQDKSIFDKTINILNVFMQRKDWPTCYNEFNTSAQYLLGVSVEKLYVDFLAIETIEDVIKDDDEFNFNLKEDFKADINLFFKVVYPIIDEYYSFKENPCGLNKIVQLNNKAEKKNFRVIRNDAEYLDLLMSKEEIEKLILTLKELMED